MFITGAGDTLDLIDAFGPMSGIHAAMDRIGAGMPCGLAVRFRRRTITEVESAVASAARHFPVLRRRLVWLAGRPKLIDMGAQSAELARASEVSLDFSSAEGGPVWRYAITADGEDAWLRAVSIHAAADGRSMLRFLTGVAESWRTNLGSPFARRGGSQRRWRRALVGCRGSSLSGTFRT